MLPFQKSLTRFHTTSTSTTPWVILEKYKGKTYKCYTLLTSPRTFTHENREVEISLSPQICQSGNPAFSQARPWRNGPRPGWCPHRRGHFVVTKAELNWLIEKPPASGYSALPPSGRSSFKADMHTQIHPHTQTKKQHKRMFRKKQPQKSFCVVYHFIFHFIFGNICSGSWLQIRS